MNKFTYALALGAGLVLGLAAPNAHADPIVQSLDARDVVGGPVQRGFHRDDRRPDE